MAGLRRLDPICHRWLRPAEISKILGNYQQFYLTPDAPFLPPAGSLFMFDEKALPNFWDGHLWRKKEDVNTIKECQKLMINGVSVFHWYYAHGGDNENFQRRSYWLLDKSLEHIVLVHYREVAEGPKSSISLQPDLGSQVGSAQANNPATSPAHSGHKSFGLSPSSFDFRDDLGVPKSSGLYDESKELKRLKREIDNFWSSIDDGISHGPRISEQLFNIIDFSPEWVYCKSAAAAKVLVVGTYVGSEQGFENIKWGCMFGEVEVSAEILTANAIRCKIPAHAPGQVLFYITCRNRLACSQVGDFEFREAMAEVALEEVRLQTRLAKSLSVGSGGNWFKCTCEKCYRCWMEKLIVSTSEWRRVGEACSGFGVNTMDKLIENLMKERLCGWLLCNIHGCGRGLDAWDEDGQGVIHLAASLGYDWAMGVIISSGVDPNSRDVRGCTAFDWASCFGRVETVHQLAALGGKASGTKTSNLNTT